MDGADDLVSTPPCKRPRTCSSERAVDAAITGVLPDAQGWPGLPSGVKFDPSDEELLVHLLAKVGKGETKPHPLIGEFITSLEEDDRFGHTHPQMLAGVKQDGSVSYFFHRRFKEVNPVTRKHNKGQNADFGVVWWHKIGKTKPVTIDGVHQGCKKIMVLSVTMKEGAKPEKTNWVMHQYYLGRGGESEEEIVASKIFYQQNSRQNDDNAQDLITENAEAVAMEAEAAVNPTSHRLEVCTKNQHVDLISVKASAQATANVNRGEKFHTHAVRGELDRCDIPSKEGPQGGEIELLDSQQCVERITTNEEFCQEQSSCSAEVERDLSETSYNTIIDVKHLEKDSVKDQYGEASTQHSNVGSERDYSPEFTSHGIFKSREEMIKWIRDTARLHGFVVVIKSSVSGPGKKPRVTFSCERSGIYRERYRKKKENNKKPQGTKKCDCPFSLKGKKLPAEDDWLLVVECGWHNHPAEDLGMGHSYAGRLTKEENSLLAEMWKNSVKARDILSTLKERDPLNVSTLRTVYNALQRYKRVKEPQIRRLEFTESEIQQLEDGEPQIELEDNEPETQ